MACSSSSQAGHDASAGKKSKTHVISTGNAIVFGLEVHIPVINCATGVSTCI